MRYPFMGITICEERLGVHHQVYPGLGEALRKSGKHCFARECVNHSGVIRVGMKYFGTIGFISEPPYKTHTYSYALRK
ncbi:hypothetical protein QJS10_CPA06g00723 [Acorus calamus]|uniref:Uncharacterized protein n=1 Tax=Acorus calamus TaxID=4465 RepID=A0AAV9EN83_ACOCL|nr:hypothetical protein QJS10_CPA06g00723 [Acorus calamus]